MKTLALVTSKGGSGKSSIGMNIAVAAEAAGEKVFTLDLDKQGTLAKWIDRRTATTPGFDKVESAADLAPALEVIKAQGFTLVILDTAGHDAPLAVAAIKAADLCLIPTRPTPADLEATQPTLMAIQQLGRKFAFVLNQTPPAGSRLREAAAGLKMIGLLAEPAIALRADYQDAQGQGLGVIEFNPAGKAAAEIAELWRWLSKKMEQ
jgi:chromosome partitioning protein